MNRIAAHTTIVIPQHGRSELTRACVASLRRTEPDAGPILIVDDGSPGHESPDAIAADFDGVVVCRRPHRGVTAAWNGALRTIGSRFVVFLNNDVVAEGPFLRRLIGPLESGAASMTGPALRTEGNLPEPLLRALPTRTFLQGWCLAAESGLLRAVGGFDESLRLYWSDTDLQLRLFQRRGRPSRPIVCVPGLPLRHLGHRTTRHVADRRRIWSQDRAAFVRKWATENAASEKPIGQRRTA